MLYCMQLTSDALAAKISSLVPSTEQRLRKATRPGVRWRSNYRGSGAPLTRNSNATQHHLHVSTHHYQETVGSPHAVRGGGLTPQRSTPPPPGYIYLLPPPKPASSRSRMSSRLRYPQVLMTP